MAEAPGYDVMSSDSDSEYVIKCDICDLSFSGPKPYQQHIQGSKHAKAILALHMKNKADKLAKRVEAEDEALLLKVEFAKCDVCQKSFSGPQSYYDHLKGKKHLNKVKSACLMKKLKNEDGKFDLSKLTQKDAQNTNSSQDKNESASGSNPSSKNDSAQTDDEHFNDSSEFECDVCEKSFSGIQGYVQHMGSGVHEKAVKTKKMTQKLLQISDTNSDNDHIRMVDEVLCCTLCKTAFSGAPSAFAHLKSRGHKNKLDNKQLKKKLHLKCKDGDDNELENKQLKKKLYAKGKDGDDEVDDKEKSSENQSSTDDEETDKDDEGDEIANNDDEDAKVVGLIEKAKKLEITESHGNANDSKSESADISLFDEASVEFEKALDVL